MKGHMYEPLMMNFKAIWIGKAFGSSQKGAEFWEVTRVICMFKST